MTIPRLFSLEMGTLADRWLLAVARIIERMLRRAFRSRPSCWGVKPSPLLAARAATVVTDRCGNLLRKRIRRRSSRRVSIQNRWKWRDARDLSVGIDRALQNNQDVDIVPSPPCRSLSRARGLPARFARWRSTTYAGRSPVHLDQEQISARYQDRVIMVAGGAGLQRIGVVPATRPLQPHGRHRLQGFLNRPVRAGR